MSARASLGPYLAAAVLLIAGGGLFLALTMLTQPRVHESGPVASAEPPPPPPPAPTKAPPPPLSFVEPENEKLLPDLEAALDTIRQKLAARDLTAAKAACTSIAPKLAKLAPEPHPRVRAAVDGTKRACEADLVLAALVGFLDQKQKPTKAACRDAVKLVDELRAKGYQDDPKVKSAIERFGALCAK